MVRLMATVGGLGFMATATAAPMGSTSHAEEAVAPVEAAVALEDALDAWSTAVPLTARHDVVSVSFDATDVALWLSTAAPVCDAGAVGAIKYKRGTLLVCDGADWVRGPARWC